MCASPRSIRTSPKPRIFKLSSAVWTLREEDGALMSDEAHMRAALQVAARGLGNTWPNPSVGCILVRNGVVIARGWTQPGGRPHAEVEALTRAGEAAQGATAYVTLEPCSHHGRT